MSFEEINMVIPCLEMAWDWGYRDLEAPQGWIPRVYKTHAWHPHTPTGKGVRYITVVRNPVHCCISFYNFFKGWFFDDENAISVDQFILEFLLRRGAPQTPMQNASIWHNIASWYPHRNDGDVLWLFYEDLVADLRGGVNRIADFLGLAVGDEVLRNVATEQASFSHMKQYPQKYDEHMLKHARNEICGLPRDAGLNGKSAGKVREGARTLLAPETLTALQDKWVEVMVPATGYANYEELRTGMNEEKQN